MGNYWVTPRVDESVVKGKVEEIEWTDVLVAPPVCEPAPVLESAPPEVQVHEMPVCEKKIEMLVSDNDSLRLLRCSRAADIRGRRRVEKRMQKNASKNKSWTRSQTRTFGFQKKVVNKKTFVTR